MARGGKKKDGGSVPKSEPGTLLVLIQFICAIVAFASLVVLLVGLLDIGAYGMAEMLRGYALIPLGLFVFGGLGAIMPAMTVRSAEAQAVTARMGELEARLNERIEALQTRVDTRIGDDNQTLREENKALQASLDEYRQAERAKIADEVEKLRAVNCELEDQIRRWAIGSVDQAISDTGDESVRVA